MNKPPLFVILMVVVIQLFLSKGQAVSIATSHTLQSQMTPSACASFLLVNLFVDDLELAMPTT